MSDTVKDMTIEVLLHELKNVEKGLKEASKLSSEKRASGNNKFSGGRKFR